MSKLIVFYSRAGENYFKGQIRNINVGNTQKLAHIIASKIDDADILKIEPQEPYSLKYQQCIEQAKKDKDINARPKLKEPIGSINKYDEIYLGYPNYWGDMPMVVYTFLEAFNWAGKTIHPFCTHEGSGLGATVQNIAHTCKGATVSKALAVYGSEVDESSDVVSTWLTD